MIKEVKTKSIPITLRLTRKDGTIAEIKAKKIIRVGEEHKMTKDVFKKWTKKEWDKFVDQNFLEDVDCIWQVVRKAELVSVSMEVGAKRKDGNRIGILVIKIKEAEE